MKGFVYILESLHDKRFYIGSTSNLSERVKHHQGGFTPSTHRMGEIALVFSQEFPTLEEALKIEQKLKRLKRRDYIEKIIREGKIKMRA
ncbi:MAG: GIY-YIG nuclease family protein [Patescibacteria group bacterium]|nr:GIY-YIG nuclease family protein [Patescibacteria group bacterium]